MSAENVALVQEALAGFVTTGEPQWEFLHGEVEVHDHDTPDQEEYRRHAGFQRWLEEWSSAWGEWSIEPEEMLDAGERVVVVFRMKAKGLGSGVEVERQDAMVCEVRDRKIWRIDYYNDRAEALRDAGLEP